MGFLARKCFREKHLTLVIFLITSLFFISAFLSESYTFTAQEIRKEIYGCHTGAAFNISKESADAITRHQAVTNSGTMSISGTILNTDKEALGYIGCVDRNFEELEKIQFLEGSWPQKSGEIAVEYSLLDMLHIPYATGNKVTFRIETADNHIEDQTYTLCGIMDSFTESWEKGNGVLAGALTYSEDITGTRDIFFSGDYKNRMEMEELQPLVFGSKMSELVYNSASFPEEEPFSFESLIKKGMLTLVCVLFSAAFFICFLISSSRSGMRRIRILLLIGGNKKELNRGAVKETVKSWSIGAGLALSLCGFTGVIMSIVVHLRTLRFHLTWIPFVAAIFLSLLIVMAGRAFNRFFQNHRVEHENERRKLLVQVVSLSALVLAVCTITVVMLYKNRKFFLESERSWIHLFRLLGTEDSVIRLAYRSFWTKWMWLLVFLLNATCIPFFFLIDSRGTFRGSGFLKMWRSVFAYSSHRFPIFFLIVGQVLYLVINWCILRTDPVREDRKD